MISMIVRRIEVEPDRVLLYGSDNRYKVIASTKSEVQIGDTIQYEPYGVNFGFHV